jgi:hypothetical protein
LGNQLWATSQYSLAMSHQPTNQIIKDPPTFV